MKIDWDGVKKQTLWSYEDLIKKLQGVLGYSFVQEHYNHSIKQAQDYAMRIRRGYLQDQGDMKAYIDSITEHLDKLAMRWAGTYSELVQQVATRELCVSFLQQTDFNFDQLIQILNYLLRWVLPFKTPLREFIDDKNDEDISYLHALKKQRIGSNLDILEIGRYKAGRVQLAGTAEIPIVFIIDIVHKADISRLAYVRGKTVRHLCGGGYNTLERIADANLEEMEEKMDAYYRTFGKSLSDFKVVIPLAWMIGGANVLPRVVIDP